MKYAVRVQLAENDWIYVTEDTGQCDFDLQPVLFDRRDAAEKFADGWRLEGKEDNVQVVEYFDVESPDPDERSWYYDSHGVVRKKQ